MHGRTHLQSCIDDFVNSANHIDVRRFHISLKYSFEEFHDALTKMIEIEPFWHSGGQEQRLYSNIFTYFDAQIDCLTNPHVLSWLVWLRF